MMDRIREGSTGLAVKIILGLIIFSFVFAGVGSYLVGGSQPIAAKVGEREITRNEFEQVYQNERNRMQSQLGDYFSTLLGDPAYVEQFRKSVLDRMVNDALLDNQAQDLGLRVSDEQIRQAILSMPQFQKDGKFDEEIYNIALRRAGFSSDSFAEYLRQDLVRNQLILALESTEFTLPSEVNAQNALETQQREIRTITLNTTEFAEKAAVSEEEVKEFYNANKQQFVRPEQVKIAYIELSGASLKDQAPISDDEVKEYYQANQDKYSTQEKREVSHILINGDEADAKAVLARLDAGEDFAAVAKDASQDIPTAKEGGSLGWIERGVIDPEFEDAAFQLVNVGDHSGVVKSAFGYHIIQLNGVEKPTTKPLAEVSAEIKAFLVDEHAADAFYSLQTELAEKAFESPDSLDDAAEAVNAKIITTDFFSQVDAPEALASQAVLQAIYSAEVKEDGLNSDVIEIAPEHIIVVRVEDVRDEAVLPLEDVKQNVVARLSQSKGEQKALELAQGVIAALNKGETNYLADNELNFTEARMITRADELANDVYRLQKPEQGTSTYAQVMDRQGNHVIVALDGVLELGNDAMIEQVATRLLRTQTQQDLTATLDTLKANSDISYPLLEQ
ncbi:peptidylprolyl isomerase [Aliivibrio finisterrensis]|uniref:Periplasmic chaperone PpiD n=1 Tax=Aliivibrio finisterrensis TaxID=511998 RepID=A0A4Q5KNU5_9GAMM|nr:MULTISPECIES: peptidylprolyl isomerase [Aliivibrio]MDD9173276.1 peptidylprolyl isomerase [Aliivibrio sp. S3TY1]MDD9190352.1 peptidylprolyl isomerase [Aliivibrio sp. S2TY2]RYU47162.1 peptidylprolyl isomerase [Aliivibrio finisterrensis]